MEDKNFGIIWLIIMFLTMLICSISAWLSLGDYSPSDSWFDRIAYSLLTIVLGVLLIIAFINY